jgi:hypothetical protein
VCCKIPGRLITVTEQPAHRSMTNLVTYIEIHTCPLLGFPPRAGCPRLFERCMPFRNNAQVVGLAEGARFENAPARETIGRDLFTSVRSQSLAGELEAGETPIKHDRGR